MIDFSKEFNHQNHNLLITKLMDIGVPAWLLRIFIASLSDRKMLVKYKGKQSGIKSLPGGGPQGTNKSGVYKQLLKTMENANNNEMKINYKKTKLMVYSTLFPQ
jgi:hypothetical protein